MTAVHQTATEASVFHLHRVEVDLLHTGTTQFASAAHEDLERDEPGPIDYLDLVVAANLLAHLALARFIPVVGGGLWTLLSVAALGAAVSTAVAGIDDGAADPVDVGLLPLLVVAAEEEVLPVGRPLQIRWCSLQVCQLSHLPGIRHVAQVSAGNRRLLVHLPHAGAAADQAGRRPERGA